MTKTEIITFVKNVRIEHDVKIAEKYVAKETGKSLMLNTDKTKLDGIAEGAQVNVIEGISIVGGAALSVATDTKIASLDLSAYAKKADFSAALIYRGSVDTFAELPANGNSNGDVWNIKIAGGTDRYGTAIKAGDNVVYIEDQITPANSGWDVQGGTTDLSNYLIATSLVSALNTLIEDSEETFSENDIASIFSDEEEPAGGGE